MYNLDMKLFTQNLRYYRKLRNMTLEDLGILINKTKATVSKYEKGEILPDITTILLICNSLNITLSQLFPRYNKNNASIKISNPFKSDKLYFYYYTGKKLITSVCEITDVDNKLYVKFYNGIKNILRYTDESSYYYEGTLECDKIIGYFNLYNIQSQETLLEKIQISFNIPWTKTSKETIFFILAITPNSVPIVKKGILSPTPIKDIKKYDNDLLISKNELSKIKHNNAWILEKLNYDHFFYDI